jgi:hypothetical protein
MGANQPVAFGAQGASQGLFHPGLGGPTFPIGVGPEVAAGDEQNRLRMFHAKAKEMSGLAVDRRQGR